MDKIDLEKIIVDNHDLDSSGCYTFESIQIICLEFGRRLLELAAENATINGGNCYAVTDEDLYAQFPLIVNKQSILDTIKQVEYEKNNN